MEVLIEEILKDLKTELLLTKESDINILSSKVKNAIREIRRDRNYPAAYTDEMIASDLEIYYSNIRELALYDFNQFGAEGQTSHSENNISRSWKSRSECKAGIVAIGRAI
jgi:hypothetical protein